MIITTSFWMMTTYVLVQPGWTFQCLPLCTEVRRIAISTWIHGEFDIVGLEDTDRHTGTSNAKSLLDTVIDA